MARRRRTDPCPIPGWRSVDEMLAALQATDPGAGSAAARVLGGSAPGMRTPTGHISAGYTSPPGTGPRVPPAGGAGVPPRGPGAPPPAGGPGAGAPPPMPPHVAAGTLPPNHRSWLNRLLFGADLAQKMALVTSLGVQLRNTLDAFNRIGIDILTRGLENGLARVYNGLGGHAPIKPISPRGEGRYLLEHVYHRPRRGRLGTKAGQAIGLAENLENIAKLRNAQARAVARGRNPARVTVTAVEPVLTRLAPRPAAAWERAISYVPYEFEHPIRYAVFAAQVDRELKAALGIDLVQAHRLGVAPSNMSEIITKAIDKATHITMGANPKDLGQFMSSFDRLAGKVLSLPSLPGAAGTLARALTFAGAIFGRFLYNAVRFNLEYMPTGFLRLVTAKNRAALARGDMNVLARELVGSGIFTFALGIRSGLIPGLEPGSRWDQVRIGDTTISLMPFASFAPFLFLADLSLRAENEYRESGLNPGPDDWRRYMIDAVRNMPHPANVARWLGMTDTPEAQRGRLPSVFTIRDVMEGLGMRAEVEAFTTAMEQLVGLMIPSARRDPFETEAPLEEAAAEIASRFMRLAAQFNAYVAEFREGAGLARETRGSFERGALRDVPIVSEAFPEKEVTTRGATPRTSVPVATPFGSIGSRVLREVTGLPIIETPNVIEDELEELGITWRDRNPATGNRAMNMLVRRHQGPLMELLGGILFASEGYQRLPSNTKIVIARTVLNGTRQIAQDMTNGIAPGLRVQQLFERMPESFRLLLGAALQEGNARTGKGLSVPDLARILQQLAEQEMREQGL